MRSLAVDAKPQKTPEYDAFYHVPTTIGSYERRMGMSNPIEL